MKQPCSGVADPDSMKSVRELIDLRKFSQTTDWVLDEFVVYTELTPSTNHCSRGYGAREFL